MMMNLYFVLDQHAEVGFYSASSLKLQSRNYSFKPCKFIYRKKKRKGKGKREEKREKKKKKKKKGGKRKEERNSHICGQNIYSLCSKILIRC
jgi:prophage tail gpP-like protein